MRRAYRVVGESLGVGGLAVVMLLGMTLKEICQIGNLSAWVMDCVAERGIDSCTANPSDTEVIFLISI